MYRDLFEPDTAAGASAPTRRCNRLDSDIPYSHGVFSSRQIEKRCNEDLGFMYIAGKRCPNFRVLSDFRKDRGDFFRSCFKQRCAWRCGLAREPGRLEVQGEQFEAHELAMRRDDDQVGRTCAKERRTTRRHRARRSCGRGGRSRTRSRSTRTRASSAFDYAYNAQIGGRRADSIRPARQPGNDQRPLELIERLAGERQQGRTSRAGGWRRPGRDRRGSW